jgi:hypothetical protein
MKSQRRDDPKPSEMKRQSLLLGTKPGVDHFQVRRNKARSRPLPGAPEQSPESTTSRCAGTKPGVDHLQVRRNTARNRAPPGAPELKPGVKRSGTPGHHPKTKQALLRGDGNTGSGEPFANASVEAPPPPPLRRVRIMEIEFPEFRYASLRAVILRATGAWA